MEPTDWAILIPVVMTALTAIAGGYRKWKRDNDLAAYQRARADLTAELAKETIETKNRELSLKDDELAWCHEQIALFARSFDRLSGGAQP